MHFCIEFSRLLLSVFLNKCIIFVKKKCQYCRPLKFAALDSNLLSLDVNPSLPTYLPKYFSKVAMN